MEKVYWIYQISSNCRNSVNILPQYLYQSSIYAYTDEKAIKTLFDSIRDTKRVLTCSKRKLDTVDINELAKNFPKGRLGIHNLVTTDTIVPTALTEYERLEISSAAHTIMFDLQIAADELLYYSIFNKDYQKALKIIHYIDICDFLSGSRNSPGVKVDTLQIFIEKYSALLDGGLI